MFSNEFQIYMVIIRPYLGLKDEKFFKKSPDTKESKLTNLHLDSVDDLLMHDKLKEYKKHWEAFKKSR